jgi:hypothetical protein
MKEKLIELQRGIRKKSTKQVERKPIQIQKHLNNITKQRDLIDTSQVTPPNNCRILYTGKLPR